MNPTIAAGHAAAEQAANNAGVAWADAAMASVHSFKAAFNGDKFLTEDVRIFAENNGLPKPPDKRAWGAIILRAKRDGIVKSCGFAMTHSPEYNAGPKTAWRFAS